MNEKKNMSKTRKIAIGIIVFAILLGVVLFVYSVYGPKTAQGAKTVNITVIDDQGQTTEYETHTAAEYLQGAMEDTDGLTFDGEDSEYGLMLDTVNGVTADYEKDGAYWGIYVNGEYGNYGIGEQPVEDGDAFTFEYASAQ